MPQRLDDLYDNFYTPLELPALKSSIEDNHKILIDHLSKEERKIVLRIIDALEMICNYQTKASFIQGFKLGFELTTELQTYDAHSAEIDSQNCGHSFMPQEVQKDEEKNLNDSSNRSCNDYFADDNSLQPKASNNACIATNCPCVKGCGGA